MTSVKPHLLTRAERILVISLSNIGDCILTTPVFSFLREKFPNAQLTAVASPKAAPLFEGCSTINEFICFDKKGRLANQYQFILNLRKQRYDLVVDLRNTLIPWFLRARHHTPLFVDRSSRQMRTQHLDRLKSFFSIQEIQNHFNFFSEEDERIAVSKCREQNPNWVSSSSVVIVPGAGSTLKRWPRERFQEVMKFLLEQGKSILLLGDASERLISDELKAHAHTEQVINLAGSLTLRQSASLIASASLTIANDSALMHLAHELNRPTVSIFGPTDERKYGLDGTFFRTVRLHLPCTPCQKAQCGIEYRKCLDDLPASEVIRACEGLLALKKIK